MLFKSTLLPNLKYSRGQEVQVFMLSIDRSVHDWMEESAVLICLVQVKQEEPHAGHQNI